MTTTNKVLVNRIDLQHALAWLDVVAQKCSKDAEREVHGLYQRLSDAFNGRDDQ